MARPYAVVAFGYDITEALTTFDTSPVWLTDPDASVRDNAARAVLAANGRALEPGEHVHADTLHDRCGVNLVQLGLEEGSSIILASRHFKTDWDGNLALPTPLLAAATEPLDRALAALGLQRDDEPVWLLCTYHF